MKFKIVCTNIFLVEAQENEYTAETNAEADVAQFLAKKQQNLPENILKWNTIQYKARAMSEEEYEKGGWQWKTE